MIKFVRENDCVGCEICINCGRKNGYWAVEDFICDSCGASVEELYDVAKNIHLCKECLLEDYTKITEDNAMEYFN